MARTTLGTLTWLTLTLALAGCGSAAGGSSGFSGSGPQTPNVSSSGQEPTAPCPTPACPTPACPPAAPVAVDNSGDQGGDSGVPVSDGSSDGSSSGGDDSNLVVEITNSSDVPIDVTAQTPDETVDCGVVGPGETISVDMSELPTATTFDATATGPDSTGFTPSFESDTIDLGTDYTESAPVTTIDWQDPATSDDSSGGDTSGDPGILTDGTTDPGSTVRRAPSPVYAPRATGFAKSVRRVTPKIVKHAPA